MPDLSLVGCKTPQNIRFVRAHRAARLEVVRRPTALGRPVIAETSAGELFWVFAVDKRKPFVDKFFGRWSGKPERDCYLPGTGLAHQVLGHQSLLIAALAYRRRGSVRL